MNNICVRLPQAQSMAQLNCPTCYHGVWMDQWGNMCPDPQKSSSNMSLNMSQQSGGYPGMPGMWMNPMGTWHGPPPSMGMYPYPMGPMGPMMPMTPEAQSRMQSRAQSPAPSIKSRKSHMSRRKYKPSDDTDDDMDRRSVFSYADKSDRKSVRERAERARLQREQREKTSVPREIKPIEKRPVVPVVQPVPDRLEKLPVPRSKQSIRASSSESEIDYKSDSHKESDAMEEAANEPDYDEPPEKFIKEEEIIVEKTELPGIPAKDWECEHCTFVNSSGTRVCAVCCKTPTTPAIKLVENKSAPDSNKTSQRRSSLIKTDTSDADTSLMSKFGKHLKITDKLAADTVERKKGRANRKISFWPGTKFSPFHSK